MTTILFVAITLIIASVISLFFIIIYYQGLKKFSYEIPQGLENTDICIADGIEEIKIICK